MRAAFYGVGASVIGIIAFSAFKLTRKTIGADPLLWTIFLGAMAVTILTESENVLLFLLAGVLVWLMRAPPSWRGLGGHAPGIVDGALLLALSGTIVAPGVLGTMFLFFAKAGTFVFGSGLAIVPFLYDGVVHEHHWLSEQQFLDAVAVAMITPGPVVITVGFIGYLVAGFSGACVAALGTFLPCYLFTIIPAPYFKKYGHRRDIAAFVNGVTAAAIGAISGAVVVLGRRSVVDWTTAAIAAATLLACWKLKKIPEPMLVLAAALVSLAIKLN